MGTIRGAGAGCVCPENTVLRALVTHLLLHERETVLLDLVAGLEHLKCDTAAAVDAPCRVVEPGQRSLMVAADVARLAKDRGIPAVWVVAKKVGGKDDVAFVRRELDGLRLAGRLPR